MGLESKMHDRSETLYKGSLKYLILGALFEDLSFINALIIRL